MGGIAYVYDWQERSYAPPECHPGQQAYTFLIRILSTSFISVSFSLSAVTLGYLSQWYYHRVYRVVTAAFWRTFSDEGNISPGWWGWGVHAHPLSLHLPSPVKLQCTLKLSGQIHWLCFISINICTLWVLPRPVFSMSPSPVKRRKKRIVSSLSNRSSFVASPKNLPFGLSGTRSPRLGSVPVR